MDINIRFHYKYGRMRNGRMTYVQSDALVACNKRQVLKPDHQTRTTRRGCRTRVNGKEVLTEDIPSEWYGGFLL